MVVMDHLVTVQVVVPDKVLPQENLASQVEHCIPAVVVLHTILPVPDRVAPVVAVPVVAKIKMEKVAQLILAAAVAVQLP